MTQGFELDAYLARIGYTGPREPSLTTLRSIHALQPAAIPFESLDPFLRREVRLDVLSLQAKLVRARRGGYCFELNGLFAAALEALGFLVTGLSGRVLWMAPPERPNGPRTHHLLRVDLDGVPYLVDVGFGGHLIDSPIKLVTDIEQTTPSSILRLTGMDHSFILQTKLPRGWEDLYLFTLEPQLAIDYEVANWFTSTNPNSRFMKDFIGERLTPEWRLSLFNSRLTKRHRNGRVDQRMLANATEFTEALKNGLGITPPLDPVEIWKRLPEAS